jgi:hypothetical protein
MTTTSRHGQGAVSLGEGVVVGAPRRWLDLDALEHPPPGLTIGDSNAKPQDGFLIWDVQEPDRPQLLGYWVSGGTCTHRNFYNGGPWVYATSDLPGFQGQILAIVDIGDPANPRTAGAPTRCVLAPTTESAR